MVGLVGALLLSFGLGPPPPPALPTIPAPAPASSLAAAPADAFAHPSADPHLAGPYFGARYYGSKIGRFTTVDPYLNVQAALVEPQRWNRYAYVTNNPLRFTDPDGRDKVAEFFLGEAGKNVNTFDIIFSRETVADISRGGQAFAAEHDALTSGFSPVPTGKGDLVFAIGGLKPVKGVAGQIHHIATDKAIKSGFTKQFEEIFAKAGTSLQNAANKLFLEGHAGRHSPKYHQYVIDRLKTATEGLTGSEYGKALTGTLEGIAKELKKNPDLVKGTGLQ